MARTKKYATPRCRWQETMGPDEDFWHTACGEDWVFPEGGPNENKMNFCPMCGRPMKVVHRAKD